MFDHGQADPTLDHGAEMIYPGERFDADQQCMLKYGKDSIRSRAQPLKEICRDLHCQRDRYTWTSHPALEGTSCSESKVKKSIHDDLFFLTASRKINEKKNNHLAFFYISKSGVEVAFVC